MEATPNLQKDPICIFLPGSNGLMLVVITGNMSIVVSGGVIGGVIEVSGN